MEKPVKSVSHAVESYEPGPFNFGNRGPWKWHPVFEDLTLAEARAKIRKLRPPGERRIGAGAPGQQKYRIVKVLEIRTVVSKLI